MTSGKVILGAGSFITLASVLAMLAAGPTLTEKIGPGLLVFPTIGVVTTYGSLFYVYRNDHIGWSGAAWVFALALFWFVLLPVFWYLKVVRITPADSKNGIASRCNHRR